MVSVHSLYLMSLISLRGFALRPCCGECVVCVSNVSVVNPVYALRPSGGECVVFVSNVSVLLRMP